jgi:hypothetical protein
MSKRDDDVVSEAARRYREFWAQHPEPERRADLTIHEPPTLIMHLSPDVVKKLRSLFADREPITTEEIVALIIADFLQRMGLDV